MVEEQIISRSITDPRVIEAMRSIPRHKFVDKKYASLAYSDQPLPIGLGQTISQPYVVAFMTEMLELDDNSKVLEIGTGSGYQTAVLAKIAKSVYSIEILSTLKKRAEAVLKKLEIRNVYLRQGNGRDGWPEYSPYTHIIVTAASEDVPDNLLKQLAFGGRMIIPVGKMDWSQNLVLVRKEKEGILREKILPVRFVPLMGEEMSIKKTSKKGRR